MVDAPTKKLPFKATALSRKAPKPAAHDDKGNEDDNGDGLDLFRQSKKMAPILAAEQEKKAKKRQRQLEEQRRRSIAEGKRPAVEQAANCSSSPAISAREIVSTSPPSKRSAPPSDSPSPSSKRQRSADVGRAPAPEPTRTQPPPSDPADIVRESIHESIVLSDSDDAVRKAVIVMAANPLKRQAASESGSGSDVKEKEEDDDDDEFEEYVRRAEEQRRRNDALQCATGQEPKRAVTELMVTSVMPGTHMARIKYQFDRPLKLVRDSWIGQQRTKGVTFPTEDNDDVVLTWQRRRVYATSTLLSLGIRPRGDGRIVVDGQGGGSSPGLLSGGSRVHLEAWTRDAYAKMVDEEERRQRRDAGHVSDDDGDDGGDEGDEPEPVRLRVRLRARELAEVRLTVVGETTVETLVNGFRRERGVATERDVGIYFDGERLEEHDTMEAAGVEDMDTLEVHIR